jgi:hypothetical protein
MTLTSRHVNSIKNHESIFKMLKKKWPSIISIMCNVIYLIAPQEPPGGALSVPVLSDLSLYHQYLIFTFTYPRAAAGVDRRHDRRAAPAGPAPLSLTAGMCTALDPPPPPPPTPPPPPPPPPPHALALLLLLLLPVPSLAPPSAQATGMVVVSFSGGSVSRGRAGSSSRFVGTAGLKLCSLTHRLLSTDRSSDCGGGL